MSKRQILMLIGVWVLILSGPGFPPDWSRVLLILTGLGIVAFGYSMKPPADALPKKPDMSFTDYRRPVETRAPEIKAPEVKADNSPVETGTAS